MADTTYVERPLVYLAGPYTTPDPVQNTNAMIAVASKMIADGVVTPFVPHLTLLWHLVFPQPVEFWYAYDLAVLARCDALLRLPGPSTGADAEVDYAHAVNVPAFDELDELYNWARDH